ncbi:MAG TPA: hypothetical protein VGL78_04345 [Solirubrobacteraceae bacterium]|jgi:hypothetical protein
MPANESQGHAGIAVGILATVAVPIVAVLGLIVLVVNVISPSAHAECKTGGVPVSAVSVPAGLSRTAREVWDRPLSMQPGVWYPVGATDYYNGDSSGTGHTGSISEPAQSNLEEHPNTFAELSLLPTNPANDGGALTFQDANALGNLPYMAGLRVAMNGKSIVVYKRDTGYGQGPQEHTPEGFEYRIDLWGPAAQALGVTKSQVDIELAPTTGAGNVLGATPPSEGASEPVEDSCGEGGSEGPLALTAGQQAQVEPDGLAAAPKEAPRAVKAMIAAGNRLDHAEYVYGGGHAPSLNTLQPGYDCSSAVSYVLHAGGVFGEYAETSGELESYGESGPGKWVSVYANSEHAFMFVAGLRFDTVFEFGYDTGPNREQSGPRWRVYPGVPGWAKWVVRHPPGL